MKGKRIIETVSIVFPEVKEALDKGGYVEISDDYRIVMGDNPPILEVEAARLLAKEIKELANVSIQIINIHQAVKGQKLILVGTSFQDYLSEDFDSLKPEGYILDIDEGRIILCGKDPAGTFYSCETLKQLLRVNGRKVIVPKVKIRDWPDYRYRGLYVESKWGPDLMTLDDWKELIDFMARIKLNFLDVGVYGCWTIQYENQITEFLMIPLRSYPKLKTPKTIRYYSPLNKRWVTVSYLPKIFEEDFFSEIIKYGKKRNVTVRPAFNSLGHNTLIPRNYPEVSSIDEIGNPTGYGFCLTNNRTLSLMFRIYDEIIDRYLKPNGVNTFNIELDEVYADRGKDPKNPKKLVDPWCRCLHCVKYRREDLFLEYIISLIKHLVEKDISMVSLWNDQITRMGILKRFASRLKSESLIDKTVINWWYYGREEDALKTDRFDYGKFGSDLGLTRWMTPMAGYFFWWLYQTLLENIYLMLKKGYDQGAEGTIAYCTYDLSFHRNYYCLSDFSWNQTKRRGLKEFNKKYAKAVFGDEWMKGLEALDDLDEISSSGTEANRFISNLFYYPYSYVHPEKDYPRSYPGEVLEWLSKDPDETLRENLRKIKKYYECAKRAKEKFMSVSRLKMNASPRILDHYIVECERYEATLRVYLLIFEALGRYREAVENSKQKNKEKAVHKLNSAISAVEEALETQENMMLNIEKTKAHYLIPQTMRDLTFMRTFLKNLLNKLYDYKDRYIQGEIHELPKINLAS